MTIKLASRRMSQLLPPLVSLRNQRLRILIEADLRKSFAESGHSRVHLYSDMISSLYGRNVLPDLRESRLCNVSMLSNWQECECRPAYMLCRYQSLSRSSNDSEHFVAFWCGSEIFVSSGSHKNIIFNTNTTDVHIFLCNIEVNVLGVRLLAGIVKSQW